MRPFQSANQGSKPALRGEFILGLTRASALSVSIMLGVAAVLFVTYALLVEWADGNGRIRLFASSPLDYNAFLAEALMSLTDHADDPPLVAILGASVTLTSFGANSVIEAELSAQTGRDYAVVNLCSGRQPILFHLALIENLPRDREVTVVLGLGSSRFTMDRAYLQNLYDGDYLPISGPAERRLARELGLDPGSASGIALFDHGVFYASRTRGLVRNVGSLLLSGSTIDQNQQRYIGRRADARHFHRHAEVVRARFDADAEVFAMNQMILERVIAEVEKRPNIRLVLYEEPVNPEFINGYLGRDRYEAHLAYMQTLAAEHDLPYLTFALDLGPEAFFDWAHIASLDAQAALRAALVEHLTRMDQ